MSFPFSWPLSAGLLCAAAVAGAAGAEPAPPYAVLVREASDRAPGLVEAEARLRAAEGLADQAGARPNPTLEVQVENLAGGAQGRIIAPVQSTAGINQTLELGGKRSSRVAAGRAEVEAARARRDQAAAEFGYQLALAYAEAEAAESRSKLLQKDLDRAAEDLRAARALVEAGKEAELRQIQAEAAAGAARAELEAARAAGAEALGKLTVLTGSAAPFTGVTASLLSRADSLGPPGGDAPAETPAVAAALAERTAAARRINLERAKATPDLTLSLAARRVEGLDSTLVVGGASLPLPLFDRNRGAISAARAEQDAAEARLRLARLDAEVDWRTGQARALSSAAALKAALGGQVAAAEAYRLARVGYEAGKAPLTELLAARRALTEAEARTLDARVRRIEAEAALARLAGKTPFGG